MNRLATMARGQTAGRTLLALMWTALLAGCAERDPERLPTEPQTVETDQILPPASPSPGSTSSGTMDADEEQPGTPSTEPPATVEEEATEPGPVEEVEADRMAESGPSSRLPSWEDIREDDFGLPPAEPEVDPGWIHNLEPGELCGTYQRYVAQLALQGMSPLTGICELGACDDAVTRDLSIPDPSAPFKTYFLSIHVFCEKNGTNCTATQAAIDADISQLNENFAPWRMRFEYETDFIRDAKYRVLSSSEEGSMKRRYAKSPATKLNIYVVDVENVGMSWGTFPWDSGALTYQGGIVLDMAHVGRYQILSHEVGHCVGLWHTFHGVSEVELCSDCYEPAGRSLEQGDVTGDLCSDTAPTPSWSGCYDPGTGDTCTLLPWGETPWQNYMGYGHACRIEFTRQQAGRMHCWTEDRLNGWLR